MVSVLALTLLAVTLLVLAPLFSSGGGGEVTPGDSGGVGTGDMAAGDGAGNVIETHEHAGDFKEP
jgi:hypothetical protein